MAKDLPVSRLNSVLLPTLGRPTIATTGLIGAVLRAGGARRARPSGGASPVELRSRARRAGGHLLPLRADAHEELQEDLSLEELLEPERAPVPMRLMPSPPVPTRMRRCPSFSTCTVALMTSTVACSSMESMLTATAWGTSPLAWARPVRARTRARSRALRDRSGCPGRRRAPLLEALFGWPRARARRRRVSARWSE